MAEVWQMYIPYKLFCTEKGFIYGHYDKNRSVICVSGITVSDNINEQVGLIGTWNFNISEPYGHTGRKSEEFWVKLFKSRTGDLVCRLLINSCEKICNCVIYSPEDLYQSYFCRSWPSNGPGFVACSQLTEGMDTVTNAILTSDCRNKLPQSRAETSFLEERSESKISAAFESLCFKILCIFQFFGILLDNRVFQNSTFMKTVIDTPAVTHQLVNRSRQISKAMSSKCSVPIVRLGFLNVFTKQILDSVLGLTLMYILMQDGVTNQIASFILLWAENVAEKMNILLNWLMGAPAGLKLNSHLTEFLGHFFLYHIYLWRGYLSLLQPVLGTVLWYSSSVGILGITVQLCLLQDILSMMTLHIYCFYVYAARLYRVQVYMLSSLWRLFRGKKWNVLRYRVDSASFDVDQLFVGTLLFTILLFLLPTTLLYYVVFTLLRLLVLIVQGLSSRIVHFINEIPAHSVLLWLIRSRSIAGDIVFNLIPSDSNTNGAMFTMQINLLPLGKLLTKSRLTFNTSQSQSRDSWGQFINDLVKGHLIYPWIETER